MNVQFNRMNQFSRVNQRRCTLQGR